MNYQRLYEYRFRDVDQQARQRVWHEIAPFVFEALGRPSRVLDPAAGRGEFINSVPAAERWAVDQVRYAEGTYDRSVRVVVADIFAASLPAEYFGGVFVSNFLEHLLTQTAVAEFLEKMRQTTIPRWAHRNHGAELQTLLTRVLRYGRSHTHLHAPVDCRASVRGGLRA